MKRYGVDDGAIAIEEVGAEVAGWQGEEVSLAQLDPPENVLHIALGWLTHEESVIDVTATKPWAE